MPSQVEFDSHVGSYVDSVYAKNASVPFVNRITNPNNPDRYSSLPYQENGFKGQQTHRMADAGNIVYPEISTTAEPQTLEHLTGDTAYNKAIDTGNFIEFPTEAAARWFAANGYKNSEQTKDYMEDIQSLILPSQRLKASFFPTLKKIENDAKLGFNPKTKTWSPHDSVEKGRKTIAYGHKLSKEEEKGNYILLGDKKISFSGVTNEVAEALLDQDWSNATTDAEKWFGSNWDALTDQNKLLSTEIVFNLGLTKLKEPGKGFPKFMKHAINNDPRILDEISRVYTDGETGEIKPANRKKHIVEFIDRYNK